MSFLNKVVLITGAASRIGAATAVHFAKLSARLSLIDIDEVNLSKTVEMCEKLGKTKVFKIKADVSNAEDVQTVIEKTHKQYGRINVVVNCAGVYGGGDILDPNLIESFDRIIATNLRSIIATTHYAAPALIEAKGSIVNISSVSAVKALGNVAYCVSKASLNHFTRCVALELAPKGVSVNAILPGPVNTNILVNSGVNKDKSNEIMKGLGNDTPLGYVVPAEQIAEVAVFLASEKAASITGVAYPVDSGFLITSEGIFEKYASKITEEQKLQ